MRIEKLSNHDSHLQKKKLENGETDIYSKGKYQVNSVSIGFLEAVAVMTNLEGHRGLYRG